MLVRPQRWAIGSATVDRAPALSNVAGIDDAPFEHCHRSDVWNHEPSVQTGVIVGVATEWDYGLNETAHGRMVHFHRNSVHGAQFMALLTGLTARFNEKQGDLGTLAVVVRLVVVAA